MVLHRILNSETTVRITVKYLQRKEKNTRGTHSKITICTVVIYLILSKSNPSEWHPISLKHESIWNLNQYIKLVNMVIHKCFIW